MVTESQLAHGVAGQSSVVGEMFISCRQIWRESGMSRHEWRRSCGVSHSVQLLVVIPIQEIHHLLLLPLVHQVLLNRLSVGNFLGEESHTRAEVSTPSLLLLQI